MTGDPAEQPTLDTGRPRRRNLISLTPLIDVVFILLVFFMLASSFLDWRAVELEASMK
ncbi:ExbD/TolR family protein, partial [Thioalkalivibrio halophilus]